MIRIDLDLNGFREFIQSKKIICYGAGSVGVRAIEIMENWGKSNDIIAFIDRDKSKCGTNICSGGHSYPILSINEAIQIVDESMILLITCVTSSTDILEIRKILDGYAELDGLVCFSLVEVAQRQLVSSDYPDIMHESDTMMIPKKLHYCWLGGEKPVFIQRMIDSWKRVCPDYEIIEWNEKNYDFSKCEYMRQAYEEKVWGFVPDYARIDIVHQNGGIYLDTDINILKKPDELLFQKNFFISDSSFLVNLGSGFGAMAGCTILNEFMDYYKNISFKLNNGRLDRTPCVMHQYYVLKKHGININDRLQTISGINIYPMVLGGTNAYTMQIRKSDKAFFAHYGMLSWIENETTRNRKRLQDNFKHDELENYNIDMF